MLGQQLLRVRRRAQVGALQHRHQPAVDQEVGLRRVADDLEAGVLRCERDAGEVDMRGDVFGADIDQRVGIGEVRTVAHQGAGVALWVVVLGFGKAVVDEERGAARQAIGERRDEGLGLRVDLGDRARGEAAVEGRLQCARSIGPREPLVLWHHTALEPPRSIEMQQLHRHRIQHLVADDHALHRIGQRVDPADPVTERREPLALALAKHAREVDDRVALDLFAQRVEQLLRERARAGTELPDLARVGRVERLRHLRGQRSPEQRRELGRSDEVAARLRQHAELAPMVRVVAEPGRVERQRHETVELQPAGVAGDGRMDQSGECRRYTGRSNRLHRTL